MIKRIRCLLEYLTLAVILFHCLMSISLIWLLALVLKAGSILYRIMLRREARQESSGNVLYKRADDHHNYWYFFLPLIQLLLLVYYLPLLGPIGTSITLVLTVIIEWCVVHIYRKYSLVIYGHGILNKHHFYSFALLRDQVLVKNYDGEYEYYMEKSRKVLTLNPNEMCMLEEVSLL